MHEIPRPFEMRLKNKGKGPVTINLSQTPEGLAVRDTVRSLEPKKKV